MNLLKLLGQSLNSLFTVSQIAKKINGNVSGDSNIIISGVCDLRNSSTDYITYIGSSKFEQYFSTCKSKAILVQKDFSKDRGGKTLILVEDPAFSFIEIIKLFHPKKSEITGIHPSAIISSNSEIGQNVSISPYAVIDENVSIGDNVYIGANSFIGKNTIIKKDSIIHSNVSLYHNVIIGEKCIIDSGAVIGADGFGLVKKKKLYHKIPHIGRVILENNVWIGPNSCIDRGTLSDTIIGEGTKLDNLIHIAHNVKTGKNCAIAGQSGIAGSSILEDNVTLAGQVGIIGHLNIGKGSVIAAKSATFKSLKDDSFVSGIPATNHKDRIRQDIISNQLPEILNRIRNLEKHISKK